MGRLKTGSIMSLHYFTLHCLRDETPVAVTALRTSPPMNGGTWKTSIHGRTNIGLCIGLSRWSRCAGRNGNGNGLPSFARNTLGHLNHHRHSEL